MLDSSEKIVVRLTDPSAPDDVKSIFELAKKRYVKAWGFDPAREVILSKIALERITCVSNNYNPGDMGWRE